MTLTSQETISHEANKNLPVQIWSRDKLKAFVERHSISVSLNAKTQLLKIKVNEYLQNNPNLLISLDDASYQASSLHKELLHLVQSLSYLTSALMTEVSHPTERVIIRNLIEKYSRLYLTSLHSIAQPLEITNAWARCWNAQSLLNLGEMYERFGSIRNYWEGGMQGEGLVQVLKKEKDILNLYNWPTLILQRLLRKRMFELMKRTDLEFSRIAMTRMSHCYKSLEDFKSYLSMRKVISALWIHKYQGYYILTKTCLLGIKLSFTSSDDIGRWFQVEVMIDDKQEFGNYDNEKDDAIMLLPGNKETSSYTPIFYSWRLNEYLSQKA
jgi:hypothetical protein